LRWCELDVERGMSGIDPQRIKWKWKIVHPAAAQPVL